MSEIQDRERHSRGSPLAQRSLDVLFSILVLTVSAIPLVVAAVTIRLSSRGPVLFRSRRAGVGGVPFTLYKLRTMEVEADANGPITGAGDSRITGVGKVLRATKLDEVPQFWNVLRGDMSIVGPRPEAIEIVERHYTDRDRETLRVRPGITSMVQVEWYPDVMYHDPPPPGITPAEDYVTRILPLKTRLELRELARQSLLYDLWVIARTAHCVVYRSWRKPPKKSLGNAG